MESAAILGLSSAWLNPGLLRRLPSNARLNQGCGEQALRICDNGLLMLCIARRGAARRGFSARLVNVEGLGASPAGAIATRTGGLRTCPTFRMTVQFKQRLFHLLGLGVERSLTYSRASTARNILRFDQNLRNGYLRKRQYRSYTRWRLAPTGRVAKHRYCADSRRYADGRDETISIPRDLPIRLQRTHDRARALRKRHVHVAGMLPRHAARRCDSSDHA